MDEVVFGLGRIPFLTTASLLRLDDFGCIVKKMTALVQSRALVMVDIDDSE
jgi:hypothetical protein